jgi:hypothetical protein
LLPASPTLCDTEVIDAIHAFKPGVVVFDNAGRTAALKAARAAGAKVIYVSSRGRQRYKAFRLRWMRLLDDHWISYPPSIAGALSGFERLKQRVAGRPQLRFLDAVVAPPDEAAATALLPTMPAPDLVIVPGGGSAFHDSAMTRRSSRAGARRSPRTVIGSSSSPGLRSPAKSRSPSACDCCAASAAAR